jgi:hypothetical protein
MLQEWKESELYLKLLKALYGCVQSALLWYELFSTTLQALGFELNPYDSTCVANKVTNGKQCTITWYVNDNKISHVDDKVVTQIIKTIEKKFEKMTVTRGKAHVFLGMHITFKEDGTVRNLMKDYIKEVISDFGDNITRNAATPAKKNLFDVDDTDEWLSRPDGKIFHSLIAKLLYVTKRSRHTAGNCFPLHACLVQHQQGLVETETGPRIPARHPQRVPHVRSRRPRHDENMG